MLKKFYVKFTLFVLILFLLALIIETRTNKVDLPILYGKDINFVEEVNATVKEDYLLYVSDFNDLVFPIHLNAEKSNNFKMTYYNNKVQSKLDEKVYMTFSLLTNYSNYLPMGVKTDIPQSTQLISYTLNDEELTLNLSKEFLNYDVQNEKNIIKILTYTFTSLYKINQIKLQVEGQTINFKTTSKKSFTQSDFALNVFFKDPNLTNTVHYTIYYYTEVNHHMFLVPVTVYDTISSMNKEEQVKKLLTNPNTLPVLTLINEYELDNLEEDVFFEDELGYYQYYFTFIENNINVEKKDFDIKNVNFYEIVFTNE